MKILVLDNYDSFTYNLVQYIERVMKTPVDVRRNDQVSLKDVASYDKIVISLVVGFGKGSAIAWGCDMSDEYVRINADYTT